MVVGTTSVSWSLESGAAAALGFAVAGALWWLYFDYVDSSIVKRTITAGQIYLYAHLPLLIGLAALGAGVKLAIKATAGERADGRGLVDHRRRRRAVHGSGGRAPPGHDAVPLGHRRLAAGRDRRCSPSASGRSGPRSGSCRSSPSSSPRWRPRSSWSSRSTTGTMHRSRAGSRSAKRARLDLELDGHELDREDAPVAHDGGGRPARRSARRPSGAGGRPRPRPACRRPRRSDPRAGARPWPRGCPRRPPRPRRRRRARARARAVGGSGREPPAMPM